MTEFKLIAYEKENGEVPVEQFFDSVNPKMRAKIFGLLGILQDSEKRDTDCKGQKKRFYRKGDEG